MSTITVKYDPTGDCLYVKRVGAVIVNSDTAEDDDCLIRNYDATGTIVGLQVLYPDARAGFPESGIPLDFVEAVQLWMASR